MTCWTASSKARARSGKLLKDPALHDELRGTLADTRKLIDRDQQRPGNRRQAAQERRSAQPANATMGRLDTLLDKINNGQGTLGQLLVNPSLYETLDSTTREVQRPDEGFPRQPQEVPAHQAASV